MKNVILIIIGLMFFQVAALSQPCLPYGITFTTQAQIDNFQTNHPNCTEIEGDVTIGGEGTNITNLNGLSVITSIEGKLEIVWNENLTNISGLNNLTFIGGDIVFMKNELLTSLVGLENLASIEGSIIIGDYACGSTGIVWSTFLTCLTGLDNITTIGGNLEIIGNLALTSLTGLDNVTSIEGDVYIDANNVLSSLTGLENLNSTGGGIDIGGIWPQSGNPSLTSLTGLDNLSSIGWFCLENNDSLTSLMGLNNLTSIGGNVWISDNDALTSLMGLENLTSIEGNLSIGAESFWVSGNHSLTSLTGLSNLVSIEGALGVHDNIVLTSLSGLDNIEAGSINVINITINNLLSTCEVQSICDYLASPNSFVYIHDNAPGCNSQAEVEAACEAVWVPEINDEPEFSIYPNPAVNELFISCENEAVIKQVTIYNQVGQMVLSETCIADAIDVSTLPAGMYVIEVVTGKRKLRGKFIK